MTDIFVSYARSTADQANRIAEALRALGYGVWRDDELPAHRAYADVIEERLKAAKAVVVIWSAEAVRSEWVQSEADRARTDHKLVQVTIDGAKLPMPFDRIQRADLSGWTGDLDAPGWLKVAASVAELVRGMVTAAAPVVDAPLPLSSKPSIAVMPFTNLSGDSEQEYFADGMVTEIATALSRIRSIFVIASGSTLSFKGKAVSPQEVGRLLGVRYVLEGNVRKAGNRVRIAVQLIDANDGAQAWADRFEDTLDDIFALQDTVAQNVAGVIEPTVLTAEIRRAAKRPTDSIGSYDLYLRARPLVFSLEPCGARQALDLLSRALVLDPDFGAALGLAAWLKSLLVLLSASDYPESDRREAQELAHRVMRVAGDDAEALASAAGGLLQAGGTTDTARRMTERAIAMNPGSSWARLWNGIVFGAVGNANRAIEELEASVRLDPMGFQRTYQRAALGAARFQLGQFAYAIANLNEAVELQIVFPFAHALRAACYGHLGQVDAAKHAIAAFSAQTEMPMAAFVGTYVRLPAHMKSFQDGIARAEGRNPADGDTSTP